MKLLRQLCISVSLYLGVNRWIRDSGEEEKEKENKREDQNRNKKAGMNKKRKQSRGKKKKKEQRRKNSGKRDWGNPQGDLRRKYVVLGIKEMILGVLYVSPRDTNGVDREGV
ncbi:hypothetical protein RJ639_041376 [Escallonia herrerae]|uniref:Uncharacterized protein n=1 Tax=Escallonia herrerae TaxID=1293975 RepID=A0AA89B6H5_9ASTE|nr:hypothetical protein RJ639_041376 [Escallonia herrerae]